MREAGMWNFNRDCRIVSPAYTLEYDSPTDDSFRGAETWDSERSRV